MAAKSFFHPRNYSDQLKLAKRVVQLLSAERGFSILGRRVCSSMSGAANNKGTHYSRDGASFRRFWDEVAKEVGVGAVFRWQLH